MPPSPSLMLKKQIWISWSLTHFPITKMVILVKGPLWSNFRYPFFFYIFVTLPNFNLNITVRVFWIFISENLAPALIFLVPILGWKLEKMTSFSQNTARTCTGAKVFVLLRANCCTNCYYDFNPCWIFENMMSFTPIFNQELEQGKLMAVLYSRK